MIRLLVITDVAHVRAFDELETSGVLVVIKSSTWCEALSSQSSSMAIIAFGSFLNLFKNKNNRRTRLDPQSVHK